MESWAWSSAPRCTCTVHASTSTSNHVPRSLNRCRRPRSARAVVRAQLTPIGAGPPTATPRPPPRRPLQSMDEPAAAEPPAEPASSPSPPSPSPRPRTAAASTSSYEGRNGSGSPGGYDSSAARQGRRALIKRTASPRGPSRYGRDSKNAGGSGSSSRGSSGGGGDDPGDLSGWEFGRGWEAPSNADRPTTAQRLPSHGSKNVAMHRQPAKRNFMRVWPVQRAGWYREPSMFTGLLRDEIIARSAQGKVETGALYSLLRLARSADDAAMALQALEAVRAASVNAGIVTAFRPEFAVRFLWMIERSGAVEVLLQVMHRANELGLMLSRKSVNNLMRRLGSRLQVDSLDRIRTAMEAAGIPPDHNTAYILIRACVNNEQYARARALLEEFRAAGVHCKPTLKRLMQVAEEREAAAAEVAAEWRRTGGAAVGGNAGDTDAGAESVGYQA